MGGPGSGRMRLGATNFVEDVELALPAGVLDLTRGATYALFWRPLDAGVTVTVDSTMITLTACVGGEDFCQAIAHEQVAAGAVRSRSMLRCPDCMSRRLKLFWSAPGFRCRRCAGLRYRSQYETELEATSRRYELAMTVLGASTGELSPARPRRMHRSTYHLRLQDLRRAHKAHRVALDTEVKKLRALYVRAGRAAT
jgi:hypothetical protein